MDESVYSIYIARQPIFDEVGNTFAYELLYRNTQNNNADIADNLYATSRVLVNTLNYIGLNSLTYGLKAFVKVDEKILMSDIIHSISPSHFILEILESLDITPQLIERIYDLHLKGYRFALNHYSEDKDFFRKVHALFEVVDYIKIDINHPVGAANIMGALRQYDCKYIAEKIEDESSFALAKSYGFHYFQGFYFSLPDLLSKLNFDPDKILLHDLMYLLKTEASLDEIAIKFYKSPYLIINLLKFAKRNKDLEHDAISSVEQALFLIGRDRLSSWLELIYHANEKIRIKENENVIVQINLQVLQRANFMQELAYSRQRNTHFLNMAHLAGILSASEIMFQESYNKLVEEVTIDHEIADALLYQKGVLGRILKLAIAVEKNDHFSISSLILELDLSEREFNKCLVKSYQRSVSELHMNAQLLE